jgi:predicted transcriptional regulator of viral defense system
VNPRRVELTVPPGYRPRKQGGARYRVRHGVLRPAEVEEVDGIPVVIPERAILDGIADGIDPRLLDQAIATARRRGDIGLGTEEALRETLGRGAVRAARRQPPA